MYSRLPQRTGFIQQHELTTSRNQEDFVRSIRYAVPTSKVYLRVP